MYKGLTTAQVVHIYSLFIADKKNKNKNYKIYERWH